MSFPPWTPTDEQRWKDEHHFKHVNPLAHLVENTRIRLESGQRDVMWILLRDKKHLDYFVFPHKAVQEILEKAGTQTWLHKGRDKGQLCFIRLHNLSDGRYELELDGDTSQTINITEWRNRKDLLPF